MVYKAYIKYKNLKIFKIKIFKKEFKNLNLNLNLQRER